jgi:hypothetical protein
MGSDRLLKGSLHGTNEPSGKKTTKHKMSMKSSPWKREDAKIIGDFYRE